MFCLYTSSKVWLPPIIWNFTEGEGDGIEFKLPFKIFSTLILSTNNVDYYIYTRIYYIQVFRCTALPCDVKLKFLQVIHDMFLFFSFDSQHSIGLRRVYKFHCRLCSLFFKIYNTFKIYGHIPIIWQINSINWHKAHDY